MNTNRFVQCIESKSVAEVLATEGSIQNFFRKHAPNESKPYGIEPEVMDAYVKVLICFYQSVYKRLYQIFKL